MKKIIVGIVALITSSATMAQVPKFGIKGGVNFATITSNYGASYDFKVGYHLGLLAHIHVTPAFSLQPEVYYSTQGAKLGSNGSGTDKLLLNYVNIPVLLQYNFDNGFRLQGGPQLGIQTLAKEKNGSLETDLSSSYKTLDFSVPLGLSYLGYSGFGVDARYNLGVSNIINGSGNFKQHNSVIQAGLFYLFDHKHKAMTSRKGKR